uniref:4_1_CTD domain-containing protein n=1 Tax=Caenorhabditis japonica TaxID=281687 RepID=A0A8R1DKE7_CAEJA
MWRCTRMRMDDRSREHNRTAPKMTPPIFRRTIKSSQVKHTVQTQSFQNFIVDGDQVPVGVVDVERSREQLTPLGQQPAPSGAENGGDTGIVETQTRTMSYEAQGGENAAPPGWAEQGLGEYVSSKSVTQGNRTIETITYKTEKDGVVETHVEHRVTIHSDGDIDHDAELSQAILEATQMNPDMVVEKIEVRQETTQ